MNQFDEDASRRAWSKLALELRRIIGRTEVSRRRNAIRTEYHRRTRTRTRSRR